LISSTPKSTRCQKKFGLLVKVISSIAIIFYETFG
jgi:hypothetical protein